MRFEEGVYFTIVSLTTIGLGDLTLRRPLSRAVFPLYAVPGLVLFGVTIYAIRQVILEFLAVRLSLHVYKLLSAWSFSQEVVDISPPPSDVDSERSVDKNDDSSLNGSSKEEVEAAGNAALLRLRQSISQHLQCEPLLAAQQPLQPPLLPSPSPSPAVAVAVPTPPALHRSLTIPTAYHYDYTAKSPLHPRRTLSTAPGAHLRTTILRSPTTISSLSSTILTPLRTVAGDLLPDGTAAAASPSSITLPIPAAAISESSMTAVNTSKLLRALRSILFRHLRYAMFATLLYLLMFAWLMARLEQWPFWDSFYFGFTALTSIGYGDLVPRTAAGRHAFLGFISVGMGMVTFLGSVLAEFLLSQWKIHIETIATGR
jgi:hypothetical protein